MSVKWEKEEIIIVRKLAADGYTAAYIASRLKGRTRNSVIGICNRQNIELKQHSSLGFMKNVRGFVAAEKENRLNLIRGKHNKIKRLLKVHRDKRLENRKKDGERKDPYIPKSIDAPADSQLKTFMQLMSGDCRSVMGDVAGIHTIYCAAPVKSGSSWCEKHHALYMVKEEKKSDGIKQGDQGFQKRNREVRGRDY
jgi:hypothetical protein